MLDLQRKSLYGTPLSKEEPKKSGGVRSPWREFEFWFMVVQQAIVPRLSINEVLDHWHQIKARLMENSRKRKLQTDVICSIL